MAIVGWPNVGKSTLLNNLLGFKLSITSPKPQTTRESILGILNEKNFQMIFVDTPGWLKPDTPFQATFRKAIVRAVYDDADLLIWVLEPKPFGPEDVEFAEKLKKTNKPIVVLINKVDTLPNLAACEPLFNELKKSLPEATVRHISAKTGQGLSNFKDEIGAVLPIGPAYYPTDQITDRWERFYVAELIREQIFELYDKEVPHATAVTIEEFAERKDRKDFVKASIVVETEGQKQIMIGRQGSAVRFLGEKARKEIEKRLGRPVYLELIVKVKKNWRRDPVFLKSLLALDKGA